MKRIAHSVFLPLISIFFGCRSERAACFHVPAVPVLLTAPRLPPGNPPTGTLASPAPTAAAVASPQDRHAARPRQRWFTAEAAAVPPPTPATDPAAALPGRQRPRRPLRLGRSAPQQSGTQRRLLPLTKSLLVLAGILLGLGLLTKVIFDTSFLVAFGIVAGLVVVGLAVLWLVLRNSKGFGWH